MGAALKGRVSLYSADFDPVAVRCASRNVIDFGGHIFEGDLYNALPQSLKGHVNILVANVPYVPSEAIELLPKLVYMNQRWRLMGERTDLTYKGE